MGWGCPTGTPHPQGKGVEPRSGDLGPGETGQWPSLWVHLGPNHLFFQGPPWYSIRAHPNARTAT